MEEYHDSDFNMRARFYNKSKRKTKEDKEINHIHKIIEAIQRWIRWQIKQYWK